MADLEQRPRWQTIYALGAIAAISGVVVAVAEMAITFLPGGDIAPASPRSPIPAPPRNSTYQIYVYNYERWFRLFWYFCGGYAADRLDCVGRHFASIM